VQGIQVYIYRYALHDMLRIYIYDIYIYIYICIDIYVIICMYIFDLERASNLSIATGSADFQPFSNQ